MKVKGKVIRMADWNEEYGSKGIQLDNNTWYNIYGSKEECAVKTRNLFTGANVVLEVKEGTRKVEVIMLLEKSIEEILSEDKTGAFQEDNPKFIMTECFKDAIDITSKLGEFKSEDITKVALTLFIQRNRR